jgi:hypothetical protein
MYFLRSLGMYTNFLNFFKGNEKPEKGGAQFSAALRPTALLHRLGPTGKIGQLGQASAAAWVRRRQSSCTARPRWRGQCGSPEACQPMRLMRRASPRCGLSAGQQKRRRNSPCQRGGVEAAEMVVR